MPWDLLDLLAQLLLEAKERRSRPRTALEVAMIVVGVVAVLLLILGVLALAPVAWGAALGLLGFVIPVLAALNYRAKSRAGLYTDLERRSHRESLLAWGLLLLLVVVVIGVVTVWL